MKKKVILGVAVGVGVFLVVVAVAIVAVIVWCRVRRNRSTLRKRSTIRTHHTVNTLDARIVEARNDSCLSRDPFAYTAGDRKNDSLKELQVDAGVNNGVAVAYPPPVAVPPPPVPIA